MALEKPAARSFMLSESPEALIFIPGGGFFITGSLSISAIAWLNTLPSTRSAATPACGSRS